MPAPDDPPTGLHKPDLPTASLSTGSMGAGPTPSDSAPAAAHAFAPPERFGAYPVVRQLGAGGMGVVFEARDEGLNRSVAIKMMDPARAANARARQRFVREGRAAAAVKSDHVVTVHAVGEQDGVPYLVMEFLRGSNLADWLDANRGKVTPADVVRVARDVLRGLVAVPKGAAHRDIKPANLWVEEGTGRVKVLDFGLTTRDEDEPVTLTEEGSVMGTPAYMAPEQVDGHADPRSDLFSLGVVLHEMLSGKSPFHRPTKTATFMALACVAPPPPPGCPRPLAAFIARLMEKDPAKRPPDATAALAQLSLAEAKRKSRVPSLPRVRTRTLVAAAAAVLVGVVAYFAFWRGERDELFTPLPPEARVPPGARRVALLVGVGRFQQMTDLDGIPQRDAAELGEALAAIGFEVTVLTDEKADKRGVEAAFARLLASPDKPLGRGDVLFTAVSSYGSSLPVADPHTGRGRESQLLAGWDAQGGMRPEDAATWISLDGLIESAAASEATKLFLVDADRDRRFGGGRGQGGRAKAVRAASRHPLPPRTGVLFGCRPGGQSHQEAAAGGGHGLLTHAALGVLRGKATSPGGVRWNDLVGGVRRAFRSPEFEEWVSPDDQTPVARAGAGEDVILGPRR